MRIQRIGQAATLLIPKSDHLAFSQTSFLTGCKVELKALPKSTCSAAMLGMQLSVLAEYPAADLKACFTPDVSFGNGVGEAYGATESATCVMQPLLVRKEIAEIYNQGENQKLHCSRP